MNRSHFLMRRRARFVRSPVFFASETSSDEETEYQRNEDTRYIVYETESDEDDEGQQQNENDDEGSEQEEYTEPDPDATPDIFNECFDDDDEPMNDVVRQIDYSEVSDLEPYVDSDDELDEEGVPRWLRRDRQFQQEALAQLERERNT